MLTSELFWLSEAVEVLAFWVKILFHFCETVCLVNVLPFLLTRIALVTGVRRFLSLLPEVSCFVQLVYCLMCPLPSMKNFVVVSCWALIGPLACSFWVLIPISAPRPNWLPSVKRVEAFQ